MTHDRLCPLDGPSLECDVCAAIGTARNEERDTYQRTWKANLPIVERRNYEDGYRDRSERQPSRYA